jgi:hypothetical protein
MTPKYTRYDKDFHFDSLTALATEAQLAPDSNVMDFRNDYDSLYGGSWAGNTKWDNLLHKCAYGDTSLVPAAEALIAKLEVSIESPEREWTTSPVGWFPSVPAYLAGVPENMRRLVHSQSDTSPIGIFIDCTTSAGISAKDMLNRGVACLALVLKLQEYRPVDLTQCCMFSDKLLTVTHQTRPMTLATLAYALTNVGFTRRIMYHTLQPQDSGKVNTSESKMRLRLGARVKPHDVVIPGILLGDALTEDGLGWVQRQLNRLTRTED